MRRRRGRCSTITAGDRPAGLSRPRRTPGRRPVREESLEFLRSLVETGGPSGYEQPVQQIFSRYVREYADEVRTDVLGNAIAVANPGGDPRVMLAGHADEIGFLVRFISDE